MIEHTFGPNDRELVLRVRAGDREAYGLLVQRHQAALYRHAAGMGLDHDTSLDLVQDAFIKGYSRLHECRDPAHVRAWLFRIVRNACLDYLKNIRRGAVSLNDLVEDMSLVDATSSSADVCVSLADALDRLPLFMREAFLLKHDAGYTYDEIADMTGATPSAVKMRVHRARELLQDLLVDRAVA